MKKVRFLTDVYELSTGKFFGYNDVAEVSDEKAKDYHEKGLVDILKEKPAPKKPTKATTKKATTKKATPKKKEDKTKK